MTPPRAGRIVNGMSAPIEQPTARGSGSPAAIWIALSLVYVAWSTTFVGISVVNETMPPLLGGGLRFLIAGGLLLPVALRFGDRRGDRPRAVQWRGAAVVAALMMFGGNGGIVWAERTIPSGMAGLAIATVPLWMAAIDRVVLGHRQPRLVVIGLAVGFVGAALLVGGNALEGEIDPVLMSPNSPARPPTATKIPAATSISIPAATSGRLGRSAVRW